MSTPELTIFTDGLVQLRRALADADPFAARDEPAAFSEALQGVTRAVAKATEAERSHYLVRALDEAIAALEVASRLADELHGSQAAVPSADGAPSPAEALRMAYTRFTESQPNYQALYHYRNAIADQLRPAATPSAPNA